MCDLSSLTRDWAQVLYIGNTSLNHRTTRESKSRSVMSNPFNPMDCSPLGSSVHGLLHARILEWVAIPFSRESSWSSDQTWVCGIAGGFFTVCATREAQGPPGKSRCKYYLDFCDIHYLAFPCNITTYVYTSLHNTNISLLLTVKRLLDWFCQISLTRDSVSSSYIFRKLWAHEQSILILLFHYYFVTYIMLITLDNSFVSVYLPHLRCCPVWNQFLVSFFGRCILSSHSEI